VNTTKRYYESMYVIDANLTDEQVDSIIAKYTKLIADQGGEVRAVGRWDKRRLAYEIMGRREGLYILMFFEAEAAVSKELDRVYRISDDVFRHLITRVELEHVDTSRIEHPQPSVEAAAPAAVVEAPAEQVEEPAAAEEVEAAPEAAPEAVETVDEVIEEAEVPAEAPVEEVAQEPVAEEPVVEAVEEAPAETQTAEATEGEEPEAEPKAE
jgi:small subunit ribosomal protein S6